MQKIDRLTAFCPFQKTSTGHRINQAGGGWLDHDHDIAPRTPKAKGEARVTRWRKWLDWLYPASCLSCGVETEGDAALCAECWRETRMLGPGGCALCAAPLAVSLPGLCCDRCTHDPPPWRGAAAAFLYEGAGRRLVLGLKHADRTDAAPTLGRWMGRAAGPLLDDVDLIAPVPLHWRRLLARRYNQSTLLARALPTSAPVVPDVLRRSRHTGSQGGKTLAERYLNVAGAFAHNPARPVTGKTVLLVDDVMTTGATLRACAQVLLAAGARELRVVVAARVAFDALDTL